MRVNEKIDLTLLNSVFEGNERSEQVKRLSKEKKEEVSATGQIKLYPADTRGITPFGESKNLSEEELKEVSRELNKVLSGLNRALKVEIDRDLKIPIFKIIDLETKEVLRQIPLEEILKFKKALTAFLEKYGALRAKESSIRLNQGEVDEIKGIILQREV